MTFKLTSDSVGKSFRTRDGRRAEIDEYAGHAEFPFHGRIDGTGPRSWRSDGQFYRSKECDADIIGPWEEPAEEWGEWQPTWHGKECITVSSGGRLANRDMQVERVNGKVRYRYRKTRPTGTYTMEKGADGKPIFSTAREVTE